MCTAMTFKSKDRYSGRTLDYEYSFGESVVCMPRNWGRETHYALIGMATLAEGTPLYYDAVNENGLFMAGLLYGDAVYPPREEGKLNLCPHELIPYLLGRCADLRDVQVQLEKIQVTEGSFSAAYPCAPLHWMIADRTRSAVLEPNGSLCFYENPWGVLTNAPSFPQQRGAEGLSPYSTPAARGREAAGLPGDWTSPARFERASFVRQFARCGESEEESVSHFFRMLQAVAIPKGCLRLEAGDAYTRYICCCNQDRGIYYYSTYEDPRIMAVEMEKEGADLRIFPIKQLQK